MFVNDRLWDATWRGQRGGEEKQEVGEGQKQEVGVRPSPYKRAGLSPPSRGFLFLCWDDVGFSLITPSLYSLEYRPFSLPEL